MRPLVVCDLDGPILDVSARYFAAHRRALAEVGTRGRHEDAASFWEAKRARTPSAELIADAALAPAYAAAFKRVVESDDLLALDVVHPGALEALRALVERFDVVVLSMRTNVAGARAEVERLGVAAIAPVEFVVHNPEGKVPRARELAAGREVVAVIGDTEADADVARGLGVPFVGVTSGIRTRADLDGEGARVVVEGLGDAIGAVTACSIAR